MPTTVGAKGQVVIEKTIRDRFAVLGLLMCKASGRVSFGDAMIWAAARSHRVPVVYTVDERFPSEGIVRRHEAPRP